MTTGSLWRAVGCAIALAISPAAMAQDWAEETAGLDRRDGFVPLHVDPEDGACSPNWASRRTAPWAG